MSNLSLTEQVMNNQYKNCDECECEFEREDLTYINNKHMCEKCIAYARAKIITEEDDEDKLMIKMVEMWIKMKEDENKLRKEMVRILELNMTKREEEVRCVCDKCFGEGKCYVSKERARELERLELMESECPYGDKCEGE